MKVLVILGHRLNDDGTIDATLKCRLDTALDLIRAEIIPGDGRVIVTGGIANKKAGVPEGKKMKEYLIACGVPEQYIIQEISSRTTKQNARFSKSIIESLGVDSIVLCTSQYHFDRKYLNPVKLFDRALKGRIKIERLIAPNVD